MRKAAPLILTALLIPQVLFAAWWNPFSWRMFSKKQADTQIINRGDLIMGTNQPPSNGEIDLSTLTDYVDVLIGNYQANLRLIYEAQNGIELYANDFKKGRTMTVSARDNALRGFGDAWGLLISEWDEGLKNNEWNRSLFNSMAAQLQKVVTQLESEKLALKGYVSKEYYVSEYNRIKKTYGDNISQDSALIYNQYKKFLTDAGSLREDVGSGMLVLAQKELEYTSSARDEYVRLNSALSNVQSYKPLSVPQIQIPRTTNCSLREMSGARGIVSISCGTY